ncbi:glycosyltransferase [Palleronia sp. KMU-117]|uniref:glycosyltransferase n=1 Tax=Palleronia sp. KMU-117 TaxID=3434108 RepID=UPI003D73CBC7
MTQTSHISSGSAGRLTWATCIATLNRHDVLMVALSLVLQQTRPPTEIVIVDASDNWEEGRARAEALLEGRPEIRLDYVTSPVRSSATQRNLAISRATSDIVFLIDDDSFLYDTCAEELMAVYEADPGRGIAGVSAQHVAVNPVAETTSRDAGLARKESGRRTQGRLAQVVLRSRVGRWINREILFQGSDVLFLHYDEPRELRVPSSVAHLNVTATKLMPGSGMSIWRDIALREQFDTTLRYYAAFEDFDVSYRIARHGALLRANLAKLHHYEAASGRIKRKKVIAFQLMNMAVFLKRNASRPDDFLSRYRVMLWRRLLSEFLKDGLSRRWQFPQVAGVLTAMRHWREIWSRDAEEIDLWYPDFQKRILEDIG